jgi:UDP-GlcNAc:undecaprenyl-phosphate GlcNAc-1-phosphate transferase
MYLISSAMVVFIGELDDKHNLKVRVRTEGQIIIVSLMSYGFGGYIANLFNLFNLFDFGKMYLGLFCIVYLLFD